MINATESNPSNPLLTNQLGSVDQSQQQKQVQSDELVKKQQEQVDQQADQLIRNELPQSSGNIYGPQGQSLTMGMGALGIDEEISEGKLTEGQKLANDIESIEKNINTLDPVVNAGQLEVMQSAYTKALNMSNDLSISMKSFLFNL